MELNDHLVSQFYRIIILFLQLFETTAHSSALIYYLHLLSFQLYYTTMLSSCKLTRDMTKRIEGRTGKPGRPLVPRFLKPTDTLDLSDLVEKVMNKQGKSIR